MKLIAGSRISSIIVRAPRGVNLTISGRDVKLGLKVAIGLLVLGTICWDGQFYLRRSKIRGSLVLSTEFPPKNGPPLKIEVLQNLDLGLLLRS